MSSAVAVRGHGVISKPWSDEERPPHDYPALFDHVLRPEVQRAWVEDGFVVFPNLMPEHLIDAYVDAWWAANVAGKTPEQVDAEGWVGWPQVTSYMDCPELLALATTWQLTTQIRALLMEDPGLHLVLSNWRSTQRDWHQDGYLNPDHVCDRYAAAWIALDDISEDAGPFEFIRGSHRLYDPIRYDLMLEALGEDGSDPNWPYRSEDILTPHFETEIRQREMRIEQFVPRKGDVLVWHPRLLHRGSKPADPHAVRKAVICHYSGIEHRPDMPEAVLSSTGGRYFPIIERTP